MPMNKNIKETSEPDNQKKPKKYNSREAQAKWMKFWLDNDIYKFVKGKEIFTIDTPPPYPSGDFHAGNILNWAYFDFIARYKRMKGLSVHFPQGWDVHGLPTESKVEKWKGKKSSETDRQQWCEWCEQWTLEHITKMKEMINKLGISIDWSFEYKTSDPAYIRMIQLSFLDLINKGYAYRGRHPVNWCTNCLTAIADAEVEKIERDTKLYTIKFRLSGQGEVEIATTRPEYLCSCVGILIHPDDQRAKKLMNRRVIVPLFEQEVEIISSKTVDPGFGTGVLMVCTFGDKDDVSDVIKHKLPILDTIDEKGKLTHIANKYKGLGVMEARKAIVEDL